MESVQIRVSDLLSGQKLNFDLLFSKLMLVDSTVEALSDHERVVTVRLYNESVTHDDVKFWLSIYVDVKIPPQFI